jgi:hypothetical protein
MTSGVHLTGGTISFKINWTKIKKKLRKKAKAWKRKKLNVGLSPFSLPELRKIIIK